MSDFAVLKPFRALARTAPFTRNVDTLFMDFFLAPLSLESRATATIAPDADSNNGICQPGPVAPDIDKPLARSVRSGRSASSPITDGPV